MACVKLDEFIGQQKLIETLKISIAASKMRNEALGHVLLSGTRGSGKRTIVEAIVNEYGGNVRTISFNAIRKASELSAVLTGLEAGSVLVIENFDAIPEECIELLCVAMDEFYMDIVIGKGPSSRSIRLDLPEFTLIGITDTKSKVPEKLLSCFSICSVLTEYSTDELVRISKKYCLQRKVEITEGVAEEFALYAKGSNRRLTIVLKRACDFACVTNNGNIDAVIADRVLAGFKENDVALRDD